MEHSYQNKTSKMYLDTIQINPKSFNCFIFSYNFFLDYKLVSANM